MFEDTYGRNHSLLTEIVDQISRTIDVERRRKGNGVSDVALDDIHITINRGPLEPAPRAVGVVVDECPDTSPRLYQALDQVAAN